MSRTMLITTSSHVNHYAYADRRWNLHYHKIAYDFCRLLYKDSAALLSYCDLKLFDALAIAMQSCDDEEYEGVSKAKKSNI